MRRNCIFALLLLLLLSGCGLHITSPEDEDFQAAWDEDWKDLQAQWDADKASRGEKKHYYQVLDGDGALLYTVDRAEGVDALDDLLGNEDGDWDDRFVPEAGGEIACIYCYCQEETLPAGEDPEEERPYEELVRFKVYREEDLVTLQILGGLEDLLPGTGLQDLFTFTITVPAETAEALRDPAQFAETE